jgi:hypothetical protein
LLLPQPFLVLKVSSTSNINLVSFEKILKTGSLKKG